MSFLTTTESYFNGATELLFAELCAGESLNLNLGAEDTVFLRFNANRVRQNTNVRQVVLTGTFYREGRSVELSKTFAGNLDADRAGLLALLADCRRETESLPADPFQVPMVNNGESHQVYPGKLPSPAALIASVVRVAEGSDLAGIYCGGVVISASRNSAGQRHWFANETFYFDFSLYDGPRAAKGGVAGSDWSENAWEANFARTKAQLALLALPVQTVAPGKYRTFLAPRALGDLVEIVGWGAVSGALFKQGRSPFKKLAEGEVALSRHVSLRENFGLGLSPRFNGMGEVAPESLALLQDGKIANFLVSSKTAQEFGLAANGANESEVPRSLDLAPGSLAEKDALAELGTGLYLSNLHYLNWSDPSSARVTGMTRYACFWVEDGKIKGPIKDLRFDESLFEALGPKLVALTRETEIAPATSTYGARALGGTRAPGALIADFTFTL